MDRDRSVETPHFIKAVHFNSNSLGRHSGAATTPPGLGVGTWNSPDIPQAVWETFQPDQLFPESARMPLSTSSSFTDAYNLNFGPYRLHGGSPLRPLSARNLSHVGNKDTISRDKTSGAEDETSDLLKYIGRKFCKISHEEKQPGAVGLSTSRKSREELEERATPAFLEVSRSDDLATLSSPHLDLSFNFASPSTIGSKSPGPIWSAFPKDDDQHPFQPPFPRPPRNDTVFTTSTQKSTDSIRNLRNRISGAFDPSLHQNFSPAGIGRTNAPSYEDPLSALPPIPPLPPPRFVPVNGPQAHNNNFFKQPPQGGAGGNANPASHPNAPAGIRMFRPEQMRVIPQLTPEEKVRYETGLRQLWTALQGGTQGSPQQREAQKKIMDFSHQLINKMKQRMPGNQTQQNQNAQAGNGQNHGAADPAAQRQELYNENFLNGGSGRSRATPDEFADFRRRESTQKHAMGPAMARPRSERDARARADFLRRRQNERLPVMRRKLRARELSAMHEGREARARRSTPGDARVVVPHRRDTFLSPPPI